MVTINKNLLITTYSKTEIYAGIHVEFIYIIIALFIEVSYFNIGDVSNGGAATIFKPVVLTAMICVFV
jgi:hypothetical protein